MTPDCTHAASASQSLSRPIEVGDKAGRGARGTIAECRSRGFDRGSGLLRLVVGAWTYRPARWRLILSIVLSLAWMALLVVCLSPAEQPHLAAVDVRRAGLADLTDLPGHPLEAAQSPQATPAPIEGSEAFRRNEAAPFLTVGPGAAPFHLGGSPQDYVQARACLAAAMLYEAGADAAGQLAVGQVVLNRVRHPAFPHSVCGVVLQGSERTTGCQFTFTCDGALSRAYSDGVVDRALARAGLMLNGLVYAGVGLATHYHTEQVYPWWSPKLEKIARVGSHLFFRWPGYWGSAAALVARQRDSEPGTRLFSRFGSLDGDALNDSTFAPGAESRAMTAPYIEARLAGFESEASVGPLVHPDARMHSTVEGGNAIPAARRLVFSSQRSPIAAHLVTSAPALGGMRLLRMFPETGAFYVELLPGSSDAARRRSAEALCGGRATCAVYGWFSTVDVPSAPPSANPLKPAPAFTFSHDITRAGRAIPPSANAF